MQDSADEQPHLEQSMRASRGLLTLAGLAMATAAKRDMIAMVNFMLSRGACAGEGENESEFVACC